MSESQELALSSTDQEMLANAGDMTGMGDVALKPTYVTLTQNTTKNPDAMKGKLFDELSGTNIEALKLVPLAIRNKRTLFGENLGDTPICRSDDGIVPSPFAEFPQAKTCASCPNGTWDNYDKKTGKGKPTCKAGAELLFLNRETGLPRIINFGGTSLLPFKKVCENIKQDMYTAKFKGETRNLYDYTFTVSSQLVSTTKGNYYVAKFTDIQRVANAGEFGPVYLEYVVKARQRRAQAALEAKNNKEIDEAIETEVVDAEFTDTERPAF